jgi:DNA repair protein SbcD/Mre11
LHADLDQATSRYAPISTAELRASSGTFFLLGHIHKPALIREQGGAQALYPGSPQALDPGEPGAHGVYIIDVRENQLEVRPIPLSTVRYERVQVAVDGIEKVEDVDAQIAHSVKQRLIEAVAESSELRHMSCRVQLVGATRLHRTLGLQLFDRAADLNLEHGNATASIESVNVATRPDRDLSVISEGSGSAAVIARLLQELEVAAVGEGSERLLTEAARLVREVERSGQYLEVLERPERDAEQRERYVRGELNRAASLLLDEMLAQKES